MHCNYNRLLAHMQAVQQCTCVCTYIYIYIYIYIHMHTYTHTLIQYTCHSEAIRVIRYLYNDACAYEGVHICVFTSA